MAGSAKVGVRKGTSMILFQDADLAHRQLQVSSQHTGEMMYTITRQQQPEIVC